LTIRTSKIKSKKLKINKQIEFGQSLEMNQFMPESQLQELKQNEYLQYNLKGVVIHEGTADYGHYYSLINNESGWYEFNDRMIRSFDPYNIRETAFGSNEEKNSTKGSAYVLLYQKKYYFDCDKNIIPNLYHNLTQSSSTTSNSDLLTAFKENEYLYFHERIMSNDSFSNLVTNLHTYLIDKTLGFKVLIKYFLIHVIRDSKKQRIPEIYKILLNDLRTSKESAIYLLDNLINRNIILEFFVLCPIKDMKYIGLGMVKCALDSVASMYDQLKKADIGILKRFINEIVNHLIFVNNSLYNEEGLLLILDIITTHKVFCHILRFAQYENYLNYYFFGGCNLNLNLSETQSEFEQITFNSEFKRINQKYDQELDSAMYKSILIRTTAKYYNNLGKQACPKSQLQRFEIWDDVMATIRGSLSINSVIDYLLEFSKLSPLFFDQFILNTRLNMQNLKSYLNLFLRIVSKNERRINEIIIERVSKLLYDKLFNNYIVFDILVHFILEACLLSEDFFNAVVENEILIQTLINKNNFTQDLNRCETEHVT